MIRARCRCATLSAIVWLGGCHRADPPATEAPAPAAADSPDKSDDGSILLTAEQQQQLGIVITTLTAATHQQAVSGYGTVEPRASVVAALGEARTADTAAEQSSAALQRAQTLQGTVAALSADAQQTLQRQAAADRATAELAHQHVISGIGEIPGTDVQRTALLQSLAQGSASLVRVTFPLGTLPDALPAQLQLAALDAAVGQRAPSREVWSAPADPALPGRSVFAVVHSHFYEGEHLLAWAAQGATLTGTDVPLSALLIYNGGYWCYLATDPDHFKRVAVDPDMPTGAAVFVTHGVQPGQGVVTSGAALLLARETGAADDGD